MAPIFDSIDRSLEGGASELISQFDYLNTSNRPEAERVRALMEGFLQRYPASHREGLRNRLRTIDSIGFLGAAYELVLHELLICRGHRIIEIEPDIPGTDRAPDFLVEAPDGQTFYFEATIATGRSSADAGAQRRLGEVFRAINEVPSPDFFLSVQHSGMPAMPVSGRQLKHRLQRWIADLSYERISNAYEAASFDSLPVFSFVEHGLSLNISPVPRRHSRRTGSPARAIGARMLDPLTVQPHIAIRDAVTSKATRYGALNRPYIVAVNALDTYANEESAIDALFGNPALTVSAMTDGSFTEQETRTRDGAWGPNRNTRVSAIFSTERLTPWSLGQVRSRLIYNPWAQFPISSMQLDVAAWRVEGDRLTKSAGNTCATILQLPSGWPE